MSLGGVCTVYRGEWRDSDKKHKQNSGREFSRVHLSRGPTVSHLLGLENYKPQNIDATLMQDAGVRHDNIHSTCPSAPSGLASTVGSDRGGHRLAVPKSDGVYCQRSSKQGGLP